MGEKGIDAQWVRQAKNGDKKAFGLLVLKYQPKVLQLLSHFIDNPATVSDLAQDSFINAYRSLNHFEERCSFYTWLYRITLNTAKNHAKMTRRRLPDADIDFYEARTKTEIGLHRDFASPESLVHCDEVRNAVVDIFNNLPNELRTAIMLREVDGLSYEEISMITHVPIGTVRSRIYRARVVVDKQIKPMLD